MEYEDVLAHFGVKGMKWGVRRSSGSKDSSPGSEDFEKARTALGKAKSGGTKALSNKEMQEIVTRMNLEQQYSKLNPKTNPIKKGQKAANEVLAVFGTAAALHAASKSPLAQELRKNLAKS